MLKTFPLVVAMFMTFAPADRAVAQITFKSHHKSGCRPSAPRHHASNRSRRASADARRRHPGAPSHGTASDAQTGKASYYASHRRTANGDRVGFATCAHPTLPFGTHVRVTNLGNARQAILTVNDRGPFVRGRIVDVSAAAAGLLGMLRTGTARVRVEVVGPA